MTARKRYHSWYRLRLPQKTQQLCFCKYLHRCSKLESQSLWLHFWSS